MAEGIYVRILSVVLVYKLVYYFFVFKLVYCYSGQHVCYIDGDNSVSMYESVLLSFLIITWNA